MKTRPLLLVFSLIVFISSAGVSSAAQDDSTRGTPIGSLASGPAVVRTFWHAATRRPDFLGTPRVSAQQLGARMPKDTALYFVSNYRQPLALADSAADWMTRRQETDAQGAIHVHLKQRYRGLPVFASDLVVHMQNSVVTAANGSYLGAITLDTKPALSAQDAYKSAIAQAGYKKPALESSELTVFNPAILGAGADQNYLAYRLIVDDPGTRANDTVLVDAATGKRLLRYSNQEAGRNRAIYDMNGGSTFPGSLCYQESGPVGSPRADCVSAYNFTGITYDYFFNTHGRDSFDANGGQMRASVYWGTVANAMWDGTQTAFGPGYATKDVVAHEWTHAVTQYTADLVYSNESGALNESISDIFAAMVDREDWLMGEDTPDGAMRSLADPTIYGDPGKLSDFVCTTSDNGGVHTNSGISNHAAYLMSDGGSYNGHVVTGIGRDATEQIFFKALSAYMTSSTDFNAAYSAIVSAASDLYPSNPTINDNVVAALQAVEMDTAVSCGGTTSPDSFEPDNSAAQAKTLAVPGSATNHNFHVAGDNDWAKFTVTAGTVYTITTSNLGSNSDTYVYLVSTDGSTVLAQDDDSGGGRASRIVWTATGSGDYYIRVRHYSASSYGSGTNYDIGVVASAETSTPDAYEPDNSAAEAKTLVVNGSAQSHNLHVAADNDWASLSATAGVTYTIQTQSLGANCDTYLYLYGTDGATVLAEDDESGGNHASRIIWTPTAAGTYYVRVRHYSSSVYGAGTEYELIATSSTTPSGDAYEPDNFPAQAAPITVNGAVQSHTFAVAGDNDWARWSAVAGTTYVVATSNLGSCADTYMYLYASNGTTILAQDDDGGGGLASRIAWTATGSGTLYVRVRHYRNTVGGACTSYDLSVTGAVGSGADSYEVDNTPAQSSTITPDGTLQSHNFHVAGDVDWARWSASAGTDYVIRTLNLGTCNDTYLSLYGTDGTTLIAADDDGGGNYASRINWSATATGTYYIQVRHYSSAYFGACASYDLQVTGSAAQGDSYEPDNTAAQAKTIGTDGVAAQHNFHATDDSDWAKFTATAGGTYVISTLNFGPRADTVLTLYDTDGTTILDQDDDSGGNLASRIQFTASGAGVFYVLVEQYDGSVYGAGTEYDLRVTGGASGEDSYEPDNSAAQAQPITVNGSAQIHNLYVPDDQDWVKFSMLSGSSYILRTGALGSCNDTVLYLYAPDATTLLALDDDGAGGLASRIAWAATASGVYYAMVEHYSGTGGDCTGYSLMITGSSTTADGYEPDDSPAQASTLTVDGAAQLHNTHVASNNDWARFAATAGINYTIETLNLGAVCDTYLYLYDTTGTSILVIDDDSGSGLASRIMWAAPSTGTYYVRVRQYSGSVFGTGTNYDLRVRTGTTAGASARASQSKVASRIAVSSSKVRQGDEVTLTVYVTGKMAALKTRVDSKSAYLTLVEVAPLAANGSRATADMGIASRWQTETRSSTQVSGRYSPSGGFNQTSEAAVMSFRWRVAAPIQANSRLTVPVELFAQDASGHTIATAAYAMTLTTSTSQPKVTQLTPPYVNLSINRVVSIAGTDFATPKVYLQTDTGAVAISEVVFLSSTSLRVTIPSDFRTGSYKVRVVNDDGGEAVYDSLVIQSVAAYLPMIVR